MRYQSRTSPFCHNSQFKLGIFPEMKIPCNQEKYDLYVPRGVFFSFFRVAVFSTPIFLLKQMQR